MDKNNYFKKIKSGSPRVSRGREASLRGGRVALLRGFTLVELIVVIAIIGLLVTLSLLALSNARVASRDSKRMADIKQLQTALELFYDAQNRYPTNAEFQTGSLSYFNGNLGTTTYISIPTPPAIADGSCTDAQNGYSYDSSASGSTYTINFCTAKPVSDLPGGKLIGIPGGIVAGCYTEDDVQFCARQNKNCSVFTGTDNCGQPKTANCGTCSFPLTCGTLAPNECGCTPEADGVFCSRLSANCGSLSGTDNCGHSRTVADCGPCTSPQTCAGGGETNQCGCTPEDNPTFCSRLGAACGSLTNNDNCGQARTVTDCGLARGTSCTLPQICGSGATANQCVCAPETDSAFCARLGAACGSKSGTDNCGQARMVTDCGVARSTSCTGYNTCAGGGTANQCGCTGETDSAFCARLGIVCGMWTANDNCGQSKTANCGTPTVHVTSIGAYNCNAAAPYYDLCDYDTVSIGGQCWMKKNMNIGTMIGSKLSDNSTLQPQASNNILEKYCYNYIKQGDATQINTGKNNCTTYGALYQWNEAMQYSTVAGSQGICPSGWHIPTHDEWTTLERSVCTSGTCAANFPYDSTNWGWRGTDEGTTLKIVASGKFSALMGGYFLSGGTFTSPINDTKWWTSSVAYVTYGVSRGVAAPAAANPKVIRYTDAKNCGYYMRCLKN